MTRMQQHTDSSSVPVTALVVDRDDEIRDALEKLLASAGYAVIIAEDTDEAMTLIERAAEPLVLVVGNADKLDYTGVDHLTAVAADPVTQHAYLYFTIVPERRKLPELVQKLIQQQGVSVDLPYELAYLLAIIAAAHIRPEQ